MQISIPWHGQNVCSSCINPKSFVWNYESEVLCLKPKNKDKGNNSRRIGKSVLPIYTATTKAIINRIFAIINAKYNYYEISQINKKQVARRLRDDGCIPCTAALMRAVRGSILCRDGHAAYLLYRASAAVPKLTILILPKPRKKLLHNVMQYSAEGRKTIILAHKLRRQNHILKADMEKIIIIIIWFNLI